MRRRNLVAAAGLAGAGVGSALLADRLDRRRIAADPLWEKLQAPPRGEQKTVEGAGGTSLNVELYGPEDAPAIVLVHGWVCALRFWRAQVHDLMADHRVIAYDLRGHGDSGAPADGDWSIDTFGDDLEAVLGACLGDRPAVIAGHSLGAMTVAAWAGRHDVTRRASAVAMINTGLGDLITEALVVRTPAGLGSARQMLGGLILGAAAPLPPKPSPISHRAVRAIALTHDASPAAVRFSEELVLGCHARVRAACGRELARLDLLDRVEHLTVPTLVIYGDRDLLTPKAHAQRLAEALPDCAGTVELRDCGHMGPLERPDEVTGALRKLALSREALDISSA